MFKYNELFPLTYNTHYRVTVEGGISPHGKEMIRDVLYRWLYRNTAMDDHRSYNASRQVLTDDFFIQREGMPRLTTRFAKALIDLPEKVKVPNDLKTEIGNMVNNNMVRPYDAMIMFTDHMEGDAEYYCNGRSCWWTDYWRSRDWLVSNGGGAVLSFDLDNLEKPVGRILHAPSPNGNMLLFNAYGKIGLPIAWAETVSKLFEGTKASVITWSERNGEAYFNQPENTGYINAVERPATNLRNFWVRPSEWKYEVWKMCNGCGRRAPESQLNEGHGLCNRCTADLIRCANCNHHTASRNALRVDGGAQVCRQCYNDYYRQCANCGQTHHRREMTWRPNNRRWYCNEHAPIEEPRPPQRTYADDTITAGMYQPRQFTSFLGGLQPQSNLSPAEREAQLRRLRQIISR